MKEIALTKGKVAVVDDEDYNYLSQYKWHVQPRGYATRRLPKSQGAKLVYMHREVLGHPQGKEVDHINGDRLDNRRSNLRACSRHENRRNSRKVGGRSSRFIGVHWNSAKRRWVSEIVGGGPYLYIGAFRTEEEAAIAYNKLAKARYGEFAVLNEVKNEENFCHNCGACISKPHRD